MSTYIVTNNGGGLDRLSDHARQTVDSEDEARRAMISMILADADYADEIGMHDLAEDLTAMAEDTNLARRTVHCSSDRSMTVKLSEVSTGAYVRLEDQRGEVIAQGPVSLWGSASEVCVWVHPMTLGDWLAWERAPLEYIEVRVPADAEVFCESGNVRGKVYVCEVSA